MARRVPLARIIVPDEAKLLRMRRVIEVAVGYKEVGGRRTRRLCVALFVSRKLSRVRKADRIPSSARILVPAGRRLYRERRVPTDVISMPWLAEHSGGGHDRFFEDEIPCGAGIKATGGDLGTLGWVVRDKADGSDLILSAAHVLFPGSKINRSSGKRKRIIRQPSASQKKIGKGLRRAMNEFDEVLELDAAVATIAAAPRQLVRRFASTGVPKPAGTLREVDLRPGLRVHHSGARSGFGVGEASHCSTGDCGVTPPQTIIIRRPDGVTKAPSKRGDSGALWLSREDDVTANKLVGLNYEGNGHDFSLVIPIWRILDHGRLNIQL